MDITRRHVLLFSGAGILTLSAGGLWQVSCWDASLDEASAAWRAAGEDFGDERLNCCAFAILAPNPHNLQPWQIKLVGADRVRIFCDPLRLLPETDPPSRQITIGFGAFLELLRMAAAERGFSVHITPFPQGEPHPTLDNRPIADVVFIKESGVKTDPLFQFVRTRKTVRINYEDKPVSQETLNQLQNVALWSGQEGGCSLTADETKSAALKKLALEAWHIELNGKATYGESVQWTRVGAAAIRANPDGISLRGVPMELLRVSGFLNPEKQGEKGSLAFQGAKDFYDNLIHSAQAWGWMWTKTNSRKDQLAAGRAWVRLHLQATKLGVAMHPLSQALQEFPAMAKPYREIHRWAGLKSPQTLQGLFRFGYAPDVPSAPRWALKTKLL